jgi:WD40-like Beta Propeller Repeat
MSAALIFGLLRLRDRSPENPLADARFLPLTNFGASEQAAALSRDGRFVAFLSNRDGRMDVWVTQVGTGQFYKLTRNAAGELINPSVRTLGFSPDGALVTFWTRSGTEASNQPNINIWSAPVLGGPSRPYLEGVAEFDWSADGTRLVYHTPGPGDPMFVRDPGQEAKQIFSAPAGLHGHFPVWSPDEAFIYFVQGAVPDRMDIWRIPPNGGAAERITHHDSRVSHPVFLAPRTLLYLATDVDGSGPWLYSIDLDHRQPRELWSRTVHVPRSERRRPPARCHAREFEEHTLALPPYRHTRGVGGRHPHLADHRLRIRSTARRRLSSLCLVEG